MWISVHQNSKLEIRLSRRILWPYEKLGWALWGDGSVTADGTLSVAGRPFSKKV